MLTSSLMNWGFGEQDHHLEINAMYEDNLMMMIIKETIMIIKETRIMMIIFKMPMLTQSWMTWKQRKDWVAKNNKLLADDYAKFPPNTVEI